MALSLFRSCYRQARAAPALLCQENKTLVHPAGPLHLSDVPTALFALLHTLSGLWSRSIGLSLYDWVPNSSAHRAQLKARLIFDVAFKLRSASHVRRATLAQNPGSMTDMAPAPKQSKDQLIARNTSKHENKKRRPIVV